jgi:hypothetical protein
MLLEAWTSLKSFQPKRKIRRFRWTIRAIPLYVIANIDRLSLPMHSGKLIAEDLQPALQAPSNPDDTPREERYGDSFRR